MIDETPCRVEAETARYYLQPENLAMIDCLVEHEKTLLCGTDAVWEAISINAVPDHLEALIREGIGESIATNNTEQLGRIVMEYARAYILELATQEAEEKA